MRYTRIKIYVLFLIILIVLLLYNFRGRNVPPAKDIVSSENFFVKASEQRQLGQQKLLRDTRDFVQPPDTKKIYEENIKEDVSKNTQASKPNGVHEELGKLVGLPEGQLPKSQPANVDKLNPEDVGQKAPQKTSKPSDLLKLEEDGEANSSHDNLAQHILVLGSEGLLGYRFLGEILSQNDDAAFFFEPDLYFVERKDRSNITSVNGLPLLRNIFQCEMDVDFVAWLQSKGATNAVMKHKYTNKQCLDVKTCLTEEGLVSVCLGAHPTVIKPAHIRVGWIPGLFQEQGLDLKVLYVVRDPRDSFSDQGRHSEGFEAERECLHIENDLIHLSKISTSFPGTIRVVYIEDLNSNPYDEARSIYRFLTGLSSAPLPSRWRIYIDSIVLKVFGVPHELDNTDKLKNSSSTATEKPKELWRQAINESDLLNVEKKCSVAMELLGYSPLWSVSNARNLSISDRVIKRWTT
ncbi:carbohydrate sulfotransferase 5-like isoform X2 [Oratosquilla oratoria]|uniref:carbohydrate sulfotransferase 5-like isoform X2 n=1 Tax=Oratosquilla oratoria TaxID=337810 RepID=UPI003F7605CD